MRRNRRRRIMHGRRGSSERGRRWGDICVWRKAAVVVVVVVVVVDLEQ
jgi:anti-sigma-K factor RskA